MVNFTQTFDLPGQTRALAINLVENVFVLLSWEGKELTQSEPMRLRREDGESFLSTGERGGLLYSNSQGMPCVLELDELTTERIRNWQHAGRAQAAQGIRKLEKHA